MILGVDILGKHPWLRYAITNESRQYWTGTAWSNRADAMLFLSPQSTGETINQLLENHAASQPVRQRFRAVVEFDVAGPAAIELVTLHDWLMAAMQFGLDYHRCGSGPNGSTVRGVIRLGTLADATK